MIVRYERVEPCKHGLMEIHDLPYDEVPPDARRALDWQCLGSRTVLDRPLVIERDENGEWPIKLRGLLGSWAHRWPQLSAHDALDTLYDTIEGDALLVLPE